MRLWLRCAGGLLLIVALSSCDIDLFGFGTKRIAEGYRLIQSEGPDRFALMPPHKDIGSPVTEIGWRRPLIISRYDGSHPWDILDTTTGRQVAISDQQRRSDPAFRDIPVYTASVAWSKLKHWRRQW